MAILHSVVKCITPLLVLDKQVAIGADVQINPCNVPTDGRLYEVRLLAGLDILDCLVEHVLPVLFAMFVVFLNPMIDTMLINSIGAYKYGRLLRESGS